jgi:hypothetical protein
MHNQTPLQLPADTIALSGHIGNYQSAVSLKFQQVDEIKIKAIDTAKNSPLGNDDQSVVEDKPFDKTGMPMGDTDQSKLESLATDKAEPSKGDADHSRGQGSTDHNPTIDRSVPHAQPVKPYKLVDMLPGPQRAARQANWLLQKLQTTV